VFEQVADHEFDFFGILKGLFNTDLGEDHLEFFAKAGSQPQVQAVALEGLCALPFIQALTLLPQSSRIHKARFSDPDPPIDTGIKSGLSRRGPPSAI